MPGPEAVISVLERLRQRKLIQWAIAYLAGAWVLLQVMEFMRGQFDWPAPIVRALTVFLAVGFLAVLVLAWYHGERGRQRVTIAEGLLLALILIAAITAATTVASRTGDLPALAADAPNTNPVVSGDRSIAVLPFANMSDRKDNEYFSDGITEDVLTNLARIGSLRVISRTSVMRYKGTDLAIAQIARELGVANILQGSVRRDGDRVRITAQLIRAGQDDHIWAESYDRDVHDIFAVQSEIANKIASALEARLTGQEAARIAARPTDNIEAYDLFLQARERYQFGIPAMRETIDLLHRALAIDPNFALAAALVSQSYANIGNPGDSAFIWARRTIELNGTLPEGHDALGEAYRHTGRFREAEPHFRRALAIDPNHPSSLAQLAESYGTYGLGDLVQAIPLLLRSIAIDPAQPWRYALAADSYRVLGDYEAAARMLQRCPRNPAQMHYCMEGLARLHAATSNWTAARVYLDSLATVRGGSPSAQMASSWIAFEYGNVDLARDMTGTIPDTAQARQSGQYLWLHGQPAQLLSESAKAEPGWKRSIRSGRQWPQPRLFLAYAAAYRNDARSTLEYLNDWIDNGGRDHVLLTRHPAFDFVKDDARFRAIAARLRAELDRQRAALPAGART